MKIIIDTNILVSAAVADGKPEQVINSIIHHKGYDWIVSDEILEEYLEVLSRPKLKLSETKKLAWVNLIKSSTKLKYIAGFDKIDFPRDPKDAKFLALAMATNADFLITGDKDFSEVQNLGGTMIISVSSFNDLLLGVEE